MAVHGEVSVRYVELAEALGLVRAVQSNFDRDPVLALRRAGELEQLLERFMARLEEHRA